MNGGSHALCEYNTLSGTNKKTLDQCRFGLLVTRRFHTPLFIIFKT